MSPEASPDAAPWSLSTVAVTAGRPTGAGEPFNVPPTFASTYRDGGEVGYGRWGNPTWSAFETAIGEIEGGQALSFGSGLAAAAAVLETLAPGAHVMLPRDCYTGIRGLLDDAVARARLVPVPVDMTDTQDVLGRLPEADLLWVESPTNPLLGVVDLRTVLPAAALAGVPAVVDNTLATPVLQRPLDLGATAVVHSATKFIGGHSDLLLGAVITSDDDLLARLLKRRTYSGAIPGTQEAWLALRGLRTLPLRIERAQATAQVLAERLAEAPGVVRVRYPGRPTHPGYELARSQMSGPGAVLSFELADAQAAEAFTSRLVLVVAGTSFGGVETTIDRRGRWAGEEHVPPGLVRLSVGIEDVEDLWRDLERALASA
jgi:cystathionine gamma-synthase